MSDESNQSENLNISLQNDIIINTPNYKITSNNLKDNKNITPKLNKSKTGQNIVTNVVRRLSTNHNKSDAKLNHFNNIELNSNIINNTPRTD